VKVTIQKHSKYK